MEATSRLTLTDEVAGAAQHLGSVYPPRVGVRHVQLARHRVGGEVIAVGGVVAAEAGTETRF